MVRLALPVIAALIALFLLAPRGAASQAQVNRSIAWERFDSTIDLLGDGTLPGGATQRVSFQGTYQRALAPDPAHPPCECDGGAGWRARPALSPGLQPAGYLYRFPFRRRDRDQLVVRADHHASRIFSGFLTGWSGHFGSTTPVTSFTGWRGRADHPCRAGDGVEGRRCQEICHRSTPGRSVPGERVRHRAALDQRPRSALPGRTTSRHPWAFEVRLQFPHGLVNAAAPAWQAAYDRDVWYRQAVPCHRRRY